ncbi:dTDP-4-dehydrorhamnose reductase [Corynebacterium hylobatis]|uniref:dTDP-4-dehydrorhamnose reductase n=1 Tax=Corynebacterium hylobatis TaxID=1859290 RepID=A0A430I062_9CORY|nr:dTDP-4-dehydrorhamnose reductase [Corynebacterium hylobatis]RSZ64393.1 dTDP-4-dehydrorhamnose reductase [Corynebacterium hylobatis]
MHIEKTDIEGLLVLHLDVHSDHRGWFKESWQREKMVAAGLPDFRPVQANVAHNNEAGTTRGLHAEPWDKLITVGTGRIQGGWCDLREDSPTFGETVTVEVGPDTAVFVPRGLANGYQTLENDTSYLYLVNDHWSPDSAYVNVSYKLIDWPLEPTNVSAKDEALLLDAPPVPPRRVLVTGADGQVGRALRRVLPEAEFVGRADFDVTAPPARNWRQYSAIINCAAYTAVDAAESDRATAWSVNARGPAQLARIAAANNLTLVQLSTDYVFDGQSDRPYTEEDPVSPLSVYGASKAAGETAAATAPRHYIVRTSWVVGEGKNFVDTMRELAERGVRPQVVHDQKGRPTFADEIARGIAHLLKAEPAYGIYHLTGAGDEVGFDELAMAVYTGRQQDPDMVQPVSSGHYFAGKEHAPRPSRSTMSTAKIEATGFVPQNWRVGLALYVL